MHTMPVVPNLMIAGAPKCGTTSLHHYLADHPSVCASIEQESRFLMDEAYPLYLSLIHISEPTRPY